MGHFLKVLLVACNYLLLVVLAGSAAEARGRAEMRPRPDAAERASAFVQRCLAASPSLKNICLRTRCERSVVCGGAEYCRVEQVACVDVGSTVAIDGIDDPLDWTVGIGKTGKEYRLSGFDGKKEFNQRVLDAGVAVTSANQAEAIVREYMSLTFPDGFSRIVETPEEMSSLVNDVDVTIDANLTVALKDAEGQFDKLLKAQIVPHQDTYVVRAVGVDRRGNLLNLSFISYSVRTDGELERIE